VHFVIIDLDKKRSADQQELVKQYYKGYIPHVVVLDANGKALYNAAGEVDSRVIEQTFEKSLAETTTGSASK
jgi:thioredoxin-related protein